MHAHTVFLTQTPIQTHSLHGFLAQSRPPPVSLHFYTQVNLQMQHTCILTSYTRMHACTLPEPPFSFLPLPLSNTPSARVKLCCRSGSRGVQRVSLAFLASVSPPPPALHTVALNSFVFFFCLVNKYVRALLGAERLFVGEAPGRLITKTGVGSFLSPKFCDQPGCCFSLSI